MSKRIAGERLKNEREKHLVRRAYTKQQQQPWTVLNAEY